MGIINIDSNSTTTALAGGATFTGSWVSRDALTTVMVAVITDQAGTLYLEQSSDATNTDSSISYVIDASTNEVHRLVCIRKYFRVRLTNGATAQSYLRLQATLGDFQFLASPLNQVIQMDADALIVRTVEPETDIARGKFQGISIVNKFGANYDVDTATVPEDVWGQGGTYTGFPSSTLETLEVLSDSANDAAAGTGARTVSITGLDTDYNTISETVTLNGLTPVATTQQFRRAHTMRVVSAGSGGLNAGTLTVRHSTTEANIFLTMVVGSNQTQCSAYSVPAGHTAYIRRVNCTVRSSATAYVEGNLWIRNFGEVFRQRRSFSASNTLGHRDEIYGGIAVPEKSDVVIRITSCSANNTVVLAGYDLLLVKS